MEKMNLFEMQAIAGGISREEYCAQLKKMMRECEMDDKNFDNAVGDQAAVGLLCQMLQPMLYREHRLQPILRNYEEKEFHISIFNFLSYWLCPK